MPRKAKERESFNKAEYDIRFNKEKTTTINVRLNKEYDKELLAFLDTLPNKGGLIKELLKAEMLRRSSTAVE